MRDCIWILVVLSASNSIANVFEKPIWNPNCPSNENSVTASTLLSHPGDCGKFYKCLNGVAYLFSCPNGLHWSQSLKQCVDSKVANCQNIEGPEYNPLCPLDENPSNATYLPNENDCGRFYKCLRGYAFAMTCADGLHWSVQLNRCEYSDVVNCQQKESRSLTDDGNVHPDCSLFDDPSNPTLLPYPSDCRNFYKCSYGKAYILTCPFGLHWDVKSNRCESPFIAKCNNGAVTPPTATPKTPPTKRITQTPSATTKQDPNLPVPMPQCSDHSSVQKFGIPGECKMFLQCNLGQAYRIKCRTGREWSVTANDCIDAALANCSGTTGGNNGDGTSQTTLRSTRAPITTTTIQKPTSCTQGVEFLSHPDDCHKYIQCDNGKPLVRECPSNLFWSKRMSNCQWTDDDC